MRLAKWLRQRSTARNCTFGAQNVYITISGCRSLSQSFGDTLFGLAMGENPGLTVGISTLSVVVPVFPVLAATSLFPVVVHVTVTCWHFLRACRGRKPQVCRRNCNDICHTVGDISTSGLDGLIAISGCQSMSHLFVDTFFEYGAVKKRFFALELQ